MTLEELRAALKEKIEGLDAIETKAMADEATDEDQKAFEKELDEIEGLKAKIEKAERAKAARAAAAEPANGGIGHNSGEKAEAVAKDLGDDVLRTGILMIAKAKQHVGLQNGNVKSIPEILDENGYGQVIDEIGQKSLVAGGNAAGGFLVPDQMAQEIIEFLRPATAFLRGNPRNIPMPNGSFTQPGGATGATAGYGPELANAQVTEPSFREINMTAKELTALVPVSNQFLDFSISSARQFIETDLLDAASETMDAKMFRGSGTGGEPLGLYNAPGIGTRTAVDSATPTIANIDSDLRKLIKGLNNRSDPIRMVNVAWVISGGILGYIEDIRDGNGNKAFPTVETNMTLKRMPILDTTNLPENLGGGSNEGFIGLIAFNEVYFGESQGAELAVSTEATYTTGGQSYNAFQRGETLIKATLRHDVGLRHRHAVQILTGVKWGSA